MGLCREDVSDQWQKAAVLCNTKDAVVPFPDSEDKYCCLDSNGANTVTAQNDTLKCRCKAFKENKFFCAHTLAVAETKGKLCGHLQQVNAKRAQISINDAVEGTCHSAGDKGSKTKRKGKNNTQSCPITTTVPLKPMIYTEPYHNNKPFCVQFIKDSPTAKNCASCSLEFPRDNVASPHDIVLEHQEWYQYPNKETPGTTWVYAKSKTRSVFYHANNACVTKRHPYFTPQRIQISSQITLRTSHKTWLKDHFELEI